LSKKIINMNSHPIRVERSDSSIYEYPPDGRLLRLQTMDETVAVVNGNPIVRRVYFEPDTEEMPPFEKNTFYIVPSQVTQILRRPDFISPDTKGINGARRDDNGQVLSVTRFRMCDDLRPLPK
jgi:hypothetical protein